MRNKDALDAIEELEYVAKAGREIVNSAHPEAEVMIKTDRDRQILGVLKFIWCFRPR